MKQGSLAEMDFLVFLDPLDPQVMLVLAQLEKKVSQDTQVQRAVLVALGNLVLATQEHPAFVESLESLVFLVCLGHQAFLEKGAKICLAPFPVKWEILVSPAYLDSQVIKVSQVPLETLVVQGLMVPKEKEEILE